MMIPMVKPLKAAFVLLLCTLTATLHAEQKQTFGQYEVHYNAFDSTFVKPDIAQAYGLVRSNTRSLLNISVVRTQTGALPTPTKAIVSGTVTNLIGQIVRLEFIEIDEGDGIYYIAPFSKTDDEYLKFHIEARLNGSQPPMVVDFQQRFYVDK